MSRIIVHRETQTLHRSVDKVWTVVSDFAAISSWAPTVSNCHVEGQGIGAVRTVTESGLTFQEKLVVWDAESHTISYRVVDPTPFPMTGFHGTIHLEESSPGQTKIIWTADAEFVEDSGIQVVSPVMKQFINSSITGLKSALDADCGGASEV